MNIVSIGISDMSTSTFCNGKYLKRNYFYRHLVGTDSLLIYLHFPADNK